MKNFQMFFLVVIALVASACGSRTIGDGERPASIPVTTAVAPPAPPPPPETTPLLAVSFEGPPSQSAINGQKSVRFLTVRLMATEKKLEIRKLRVSIAATTPGCAVKGSAGTSYVRSIRIRDSLGATVMRPMELGSALPNSAADTGAIEFVDAFTLDAKTAKELTLVSDLSETQDASGEFFRPDGCAYRATLRAFTSSDVVVDDTRAAVDSSRIVPNGPFVGNTVTVRAHGTVNIVDYDLEGHASRIVVAGKDVWEKFADYMVCASDEDDASVTRLTVKSGTVAGLKMDDADFVSVGIRSYGDVLGVGVLPPGGTGKVSIALSKPIWAPKGGACTPFEIVAKIANVQASSAVGGSWIGVCRSGHAPALGLATDPSDPTKLDIDATNATTTKVLVADAAKAHMGNPMVIRKSQPIVTQLPLSTTTLADADLDLMKFQVAADSAGPVTVKQVMLSFAASKGGLTMSNFRLRRGSTDVDTAMYAITDLQTGADLMGGSIAPDGGFSARTIVVSSKPGHEEIVSGSGDVFTVHASLHGVQTGHVLNIGFRRTSGPLNVVTGGLTNAVEPEGIFSSNVFNIVSGSSTAVFPGTFVWSDLSEVPHSAALGTAGGSRDWIDDQLIQNLTGSVTLTR